MNKIIKYLSLFIVLFWLPNSINASEIDLLAPTFATKDGNMLHWSKASTDSISVLDPTTGNEYIYIAISEPYVYKVNQDSTYFINQLQVKPFFNTTKYKSFEAYFEDELIKIAHYKPQTIEAIGLKNCILDKNGKIVYFDFCFTQNNNELDIKTLQSQYPEQMGALLYELNQIMKHAPQFLPGKKNNKNVPTILNTIQPLGLKQWI